jgi:hypothetical protein
VEQLTLDPYGTHVIEKVVSCFKEDYIDFIYNFVINNFMKLANHSNGLCVVKKIIIHALKGETFEKLKDLLISNAMILIQNPYGNYAIQVAFDVNLT